MRLAKEQRTIRFVVPGLIAFYLIALVAVILIRPTGLLGWRAQR